MKTEEEIREQLEKLKFLKDTESRFTLITFTNLIKLLEWVLE